MWLGVLWVLAVAMSTPSTGTSASNVNEDATTWAESTGGGTFEDEARRNGWTHPPRRIKWNKSQARRMKKMVDTKHPARRGWMAGAVLTVLLAWLVLFEVKMWLATVVALTLVGGAHVKRQVWAVCTVTSETKVAPRRPARLIDAMTPYGDVGLEESVETRDGWMVASRLTEEQKVELLELLNRNKGAFAWSNDDIPGYSGVDGPFKIDVTDKSVETRQRQRRLNKAEQEKVDEWYQAFLDAGYIREYKLGEHQYGLHAMNTTVAAKKDAKTGEWTDCRVCADSRSVNAITIRDRRGMHRADDQIARLSAAKYITAVDLRKGFNQVPMDPGSIHLTQFWWKGKIYVWERMTFGYVNAAAKFQTVMDRELAVAGLDNETTCYIDDLCVHHDEWSDHLKALERMFAMCNTTGLRLHPDKSKFGLATVEFLGHKVGGNGVTPDEAKVKAIIGMGRPESASDLRSQLGLISYYRSFIPNASAMIEGMRPLLKKGAVWVKGAWTDEHQAQLDELKEKLATPGVGLFHFDDELETHVYTDFSSYGIAAVLAQVGPDGKERLCACISRSLNVHEAKYPSYYGELLAVTWALRTFHPYIWGRHIKLITDHQPLVWLMDSSQKKNAHHTRWALMVEQYDLVVIHRAGASHANADVPSRFPLATEEDNSGARLDDGEERNLGGQVRLATPEEYAEWYTAVARNPGNKATQSDLNLDGVPVTIPNPSPDMASTVGNGKGEEVGRAVAGALIKGEPYGAVAPLRVTMRASVCVSPADKVSHEVCAMVNDAVEDETVETPLTEWRRRLKHVVRGELLPSTDHVGNAIWSSPVVVVEGPGVCGRGVHAAWQSGLQVNMCVSVETYQLREQMRDEYVRARLPPGWVAQRTDSGVEQLWCQAWQDNNANVTELVERTRAVACGAEVVVAGLMADEAELDADTRWWKRIASANAAVVIETHARHARGNWWDGWIESCNRRPVITNVERMDLLAAVLADEGDATTSVAERGTSAHQENKEPSMRKGDATARQMAAVARNVADGISMRDMLQLAREVSEARDEWERSTGTEAQQVGVAAKLWSRNVMPWQGNRPNGAAVASLVCNWDWCLRNPMPSGQEGVKERLDKKGLGYVDANPEVSAARKCMARWARCRVQDEEGKAIAAVCQHEKRNLSQQPVTKTRLPGWPKELRDRFVHAIDGGSELLVQQYETGTEYRVFVPRREENNAEVAAAIASEVTSTAASADPWEDEELMLAMREGGAGAVTDVAKRSRVARRMRSYATKQRDGEMVLLFVPDGRRPREVPPPGKREEVIDLYHRKTGHFGVRRTYELVKLHYWWPGMYRQVATVVGKCAACDLAKARPNRKAGGTELQSLPIQGLFFRWHVDFAGPFNETERGNKYILIFIDAFSKELVAVPTPDRTSSNVAYAFLQHVLSRYGAPAVVTSDNGQEFVGGEFAELLREACIDHRTTSRNHPQANGQVERVVQTVKESLKRLTVDAEEHRDWDVLLMWVVLGYRCSKQASSGMSPFEVVYGTEPQLAIGHGGAFADELVYEGVEEDDARRATEATAVSLLKRAVAMKKMVATIDSNLKVAQHRDSLRYAQLRDGTYWRKLRKFEVGDFVYVARAHAKGLEAKVMRTVLRVKEARSEDVFVLEGRDGATIVEQAVNMAPCHLPDLDGTVDGTLLKAAWRCQGCNGDREHSKMIVCDGCGKAWHIWCVTPPLKVVPQTTWVCEACSMLGYQPSPSTFGDGAYRPPPTVTARLRDERGLALHGRRVMKEFDVGPGVKEQHEGTVLFEATAHPPYRFRIRYDDGDEETMYEAEVRKYLLPSSGEVNKDKSDNVKQDTRVTRLRSTRGSHVAAALAWKNETMLCKSKEVLPLMDNVVLAKLMQELQPGCSARTVSNMARAVALMQTPRALPCVTTVPGALEQLWEHVALDKFEWVLDPFAGTKAVASYLSGQEVRVVSNDLNPGHGAELCMNACQPVFWQRMAKQGVEAVVCSPWFDCLDLVVPLMVKATAKVVCVHVSYSYYATMPRARASMLKQWMDEGRVAVISNLPRVGRQRQCAWLCIFASVAIRKQLVRRESSEVGWLFVADPEAPMALVI